jgi:hypothetical protein
MTVSRPRRRVHPQPQPRAREAPLALPMDLARQRNIAPTRVLLPTSSPAFLGPSPVKKEGFNTPSKSSQS